MKLLKNFFTLVMVFTLIACSSDDDSVPYELNNTNLSAGSYDLTYYNSYTTATVDINGLEIISEFSATGETFQFTINFFEDGTYIADGQYVVNETVTVSGQITEQDTYIEDVDNEQGTYVANNDAMQLIMDDDVFDVILFNANELRISLNNMYTEEGVDYSETGEIRLVR
ncbi:MAG: hypothetical protein P8P41_02815 [Flavobacteriaceae bacterium]|nr:hypothetical protein [Flavobacteriaceae bacterium]